MAENDPILEQRVEALEQFSQTRVVEQVGDLTERVSALESARTAENPYLASKADIARLEAQHIATQEQIAAQSEQFSKDLQAQSEVFNTRLATQSERFDNAQKAQTEQLRREWEERINRLISWMVVAIISFIGTAVAFAALILNRLPN
ncbi:MAG: hypothetical protein OXT68_00570 [Chloroflexota bacterium]|nr:hypothetical protein [Chloroflexota bacterium]MDE2949231.1 hypothetical protein [Chloroflexota bacterium]